ncbi:hypothetical protein QZH41_015640, partial [Actinostola sp. cb2023]
MDECQQKHQKVYSFLKRTLPQDRYEGIRVIEPCIIVADGFNKAFKFAILGDEMIYITENPPKLAKDIRITIDLSTVTNIEMKSTLHFGEQSATTGSQSRTFSKVDNSQLLTLFNQLKTEILHSHRMEKTFVLINELLTAAQKSFSLKKLFWKSSELFQFIVDQVQLYLPHSPSRSSKRKGNNRADEFDFVVVLLECLVCMFRETEILSSRLNVLKTNKGKAVKDLLQSILSTPTISRRSEPKISPAAQLLLMGASDDVSKREDETNQLVNEITDCSTAMLYEIVAAVHQALNFPVESNTLNICWLVKILDSMIST